MGSMIDMLRSGATMLSESCPECSYPLFKKGKDIICPSCRRLVKIVREDEYDKVKSSLIRSNILEQLDQTICVKLQELTEKLNTKNFDDIDELNQLSRLMIAWLEALEKIKKAERRED